MPDPESVTLPPPAPTPPLFDVYAALYHLAKRELALLDCGIKMSAIVDGKLALVDQRSIAAEVSREQMTAEYVLMQRAVAAMQEACAGSITPNP